MIINDHSLFCQVTKEHLSKQTGPVKSFDVGQMNLLAIGRSDLVKAANGQLAEELQNLRVQLNIQQHALSNAEHKAKTFNNRNRDAKDKVSRDTKRLAATLGITLGVNLSILPSSLKKLTIKQQRDIQNKFNVQVVPDHNRRSIAARKANQDQTLEEQGFIHEYMQQVTITNRAIDALNECQARYNALAKSFA